MQKAVCAGALLLLGGIPATAQQHTHPNLPVDEKSGQVTYREVVNVPGATRTELLRRLDHWLSSFYPNPEAVVKERDSSHILISHKFRLYRIERNKKGEETGRYQAGLMMYTLRVDLKDGAYRYTITNLRQYESTPIPIEKWLNSQEQEIIDYLKQVDEYCRKLISSLKETMGEPLHPASDEDW